MKFCTCFCHGIEICIWFGYNPWINFCHFFHFVNFVIFWPQILWKCINSGYLVSTTPYIMSCLPLCNFAHLFFHGLKMCMWFGFNPGVNFCHFSTLLTLSFFAGATSVSPKFDLYFWNLQQIGKVTRLFCWHQDFVHEGLSDPVPGLYTCGKTLKNVYKIRFQRKLFEICNKWSKW